MRFERCAVEGSHITGSPFKPGYQKRTCHGFASNRTGKMRRRSFYQEVSEALAQAEAEKVDAEIMAVLTCAKCGKHCKSLAGRKSHERHCKGRIAED